MSESLSNRPPEGLPANTAWDTLITNENALRRKEYLESQQGQNELTKEEKFDAQIASLDADIETAKAAGDTATEQKKRAEQEALLESTVQDIEKERKKYTIQSMLGTMQAIGNKAAADGATQIGDIALPPAAVPAAEISPAQENTTDLAEPQPAPAKGYEVRDLSKYSPDIQKALSEELDWLYENRHRLAFQGAGKYDQARADIYATADAMQAKLDRPQAAESSWQNASETDIEEALGLAEPNSKAPAPEPATIPDPAPEPAHNPAPEPAPEPAPASEAAPTPRADYSELIAAIEGARPVLSNKADLLIGILNGPTIPDNIKVEKFKEAQDSLTPDEMLALRTSLRSLQTSKEAPEAAPKTESEEAPTIPEPAPQPAPLDSAEAAPAEESNYEGMSDTELEASLEQDKALLAALEADLANLNTLTEMRPPQAQASQIPPLPQAPQSQASPNQPQGPQASQEPQGPQAQESQANKESTSDLINSILGSSRAMNGVGVFEAIDHGRDQFTKEQYDGIANIIMDPGFSNQDVRERLGTYLSTFTPSQLQYIADRLSGHSYNANVTS